MKNSQRHLFTLPVLAGLVLVSASQVNAAVRCEKQYGGQYGDREVCVPVDIEIDKKVFVNADAKKALKARDDFKGTQDWINNFLLTDPFKFAPGQEVRFQVVIENVSKKNFGKVEVRDFLPSELKVTSSETKFTIENFKAGDKHDFYVNAKVAESADLPKNVDCVANIAEVWTDNSLFQSKDTAQICYDKAGRAAVSKLPVTGPTAFISTILASLATGFAGLKLFLVKRKRVSGA